MKLEAAAFHSRAGSRLFTAGPGAAPSPRARAKVEPEQLELHSCPSAFCLQKGLMLQFFHFFFLFQPRDSALQKHQSRVMHGRDCSSGFGTVFLGKDLNMGTETGIKYSRSASSAQPLQGAECQETLRQLMVVRSWQMKVKLESEKR